MTGALLWLWQLPQNILGLLLVAIYRPERHCALDNGVKVYFSRRMHGGISLGCYCLVQGDHCPQCRLVRHEVGHTKQSRILGPLYLPVIGIPSLLWAGVHRHIAPSKSYYWFFTEKWADRIAGIVRGA